MTLLLTCRDYTPIMEVPWDADLPRECAAAEAQRDDGYAVIARRDGMIVADAEGWTGAEEHYVDAATRTGMYDRD